MGNKIISLGILVFSLLLAFGLFGCTSLPVCGNNVCDVSETSSNCSADCGVSETSLKIAWKSAEPWAITDWTNDGNIFTVVLKNNSSDPLVLEKFQASSSDYLTELSKEVSPGATTVLDVPSTVMCSSGGKYSYPKQGIEITYNTNTVQNKVEYGVADIAGTCNNSSVSVCSDSDDGNEVYVKGLTKGVFYGTTQYTENYDYCIIASDGNLTGQLVENYCDSKGYLRDDEVFTCPNGCLDGACIADSEEQISREAWKSAEPWAITDWQTDGNLINMTLKNNADENLIFKEIKLDSFDTVSPTSDLSISSGESFVVSLPATYCFRYNVPGVKIFQKEDIVITYDSLSIENKKQYGIADIFTDCYLEN